MNHSLCSWEITGDILGRSQRSRGVPALRSCIYVTILIGGYIGNKDALKLVATFNLLRDIVTI
jgi:hypothetical protein